MNESLNTKLGSSLTLQTDFGEVIIHSVLFQSDFSFGVGVDVGVGRDETTGLLPSADPVAGVATQRFPELRKFLQKIIGVNFFLSRHFRGFCKTFHWLGSGCSSEVEPTPLKCIGRGFKS